LIFKHNYVIKVNVKRFGHIKKAWNILKLCLMKKVV